MALIVEDGTGLPNADAYVSVAEFKAYADAYGLSYDGKTDPQIEAAIRRGTSYIDQGYYRFFTGSKKNGRTQALQWPRTGATDRDGAAVASTSVPVEVKRAASEASGRELTAPGSLSPDYVPASTVKREKVDVLEVEYVGSAGDPGANPLRPVVSVISDILGPLIGAPLFAGAAFVV